MMVKEAMKKLSAELQQVTTLRLKGGEGGWDQMAQALLETFRQTSWAGALSSDGCSLSAHILSRLTGGVHSWNGTRVQQSDPLHVRAAKLWGKLRSGVRVVMQQPKALEGEEEEEGLLRGEEDR
ncbi:MAG: hypothetical protein SGPRY_010964 [Prymnesium sp.]